MSVPTNWRLILYQDEIQQRISVLAGLIDKTLDGKDVVICSILKGAVYFTVDLSRAMKLPHSVYFVDASSYEGQTQSDEVELLSLLVPEKFHQKHVLLVDELFDNGKTIHTVKQLLLSRDDLGLDGSDITTCVLFKKGKKTPFEPPDMVGFDDMLDVWYVGYGLDDNGLSRNLTDLYAVPKIPGIPKSPDDRRIFGYDADVFITNHREFLLKGISD